MTLAHRVGPLLAPIAPPGSARRRVLGFGYRACRALPSLLTPRNLTLQAAIVRDFLRLHVALLFCHDPLAREQIKSAGGYRWRIILGSLAFPAVDRPRVSIIVAVCNQFRKTLECLQEVSTSSAGVAYELIVVDDRSSDRAFRMLNKVPGLVVLRNARKLGTFASYNRAAQVARGGYLVFLDQNTRPTPGWLDALEQTFRDAPETGLAGAKLILPDGRLLEAGAALSRDGAHWSYGKFGEVDHPDFNFAREVDYCSGALMVPGVLFRGLGGFDERHSLEPYGEVDLAFRINHSGHKVIYQPRAKMIRHAREPQGAGKSAELSALEQVGQTNFRKQWRDRLERHPESTRGISRLVRAHGAPAEQLGQVLVIDHRIPTLDRDCGSFRMVELIRGIQRRGHHVTLIPDNMFVFPPYLEDLQRSGIEVVHPPFYRAVEDYLKQHGREFNLAILSRADVADRHLEAVRRNAPQARIVFDTVDLCFVREERQARIAANPDLVAAARRRKEQELRLTRSVDLTLVVSPIEKNVLEEECGNQVDVRILPTIYPVGTADPPDWKERHDIVFIGGFAHVPNVDAVLYFAAEILPLIQARIPDACFNVVGPDPPPEILRLASSTIRILGFVPDVKPIFDHALVSVAPIRFGAGVKGKVNQSMSFGVPTVVTSIAAEGMFLTHGENAMIADEPELFADAVAELWSSPELWRKVSRNGLRNLIDHFSVEAAAKPIDEILAWAGLRSTPRK
jgi:O-antigen biosynthesis protein